MPDFEKKIKQLLDLHLFCDERKYINPQLMRCKNNNICNILQVNNHLKYETQQTLTVRGKAENNDKDAEFLKRILPFILFFFKFSKR